MAWRPDESALFLRFIEPWRSYHKAKGSGKETMDSKVCTKCGIERPLSDFSKNKNGLYGRRSRCKECVRGYYVQNKEKISEWGTQYYAQNRETILERKSAYRTRNKDKISEREVGYRARNKDKIAERKSGWYSDFYTQNKEGVSVRMAVYYIKNKERIDNRVAVWRASNPEKVSAIRKRRKARKRGALICDLTPAQWLEILDVWEYRCSYCGMPFGNPTQDHMVPLSRGGHHTKENITPACVSCNSSKGTKTAPEYIRQISSG